MNKDKKKQAKKVYDATVIDEALLIKAVKDYLHQNKILQKQSINLATIKHLSLSFQNIWKIQYLQGLDKLEKLQLDNNIIEKIENLSHLVNLKWLDLSFNNITKIEGLEALVNLTDLSLYNNKITALEGLHNCTKLNVFSIGNNYIKSFEEFLTYFETRFRYLQVLNVAGNPFTEYENHLISHLPNLRYLDYIFIDDGKRKMIRQLDDKFKTEEQSKYLHDLKIEEKNQQDAVEERRKKQAAKMHLLDNFHEELVQEEELDKLRKIKEVDDEIGKFTGKIKEIVEVLQKKIKEKNEEKLKEIAKFEKSIREREIEAEKETIDVLNDFEKEKKAIIRMIDAKKDRHVIREEIRKLKDKIDLLKDRMYGIEMQLVEDVDSNLKNFVGVFTEYTKAMELTVSTDQGYFKNIDQEIKDFGDKINKISKEALENLMKNNTEDTDYSSDPDLGSFMDNRDTLQSTVISIRDKLSEKKNKVESTVTAELCQKEMDSYMKGFGERQYERNRKNISNIKSKVAAVVESVDNLIEEEQEDDEHY